MDRIKSKLKKVKDILMLVWSSIIIVLGCFLILSLTNIMDKTKEITTDIISDNLNTNLFEHKGKIADIKMRQEGILEIQYKLDNTLVIFVENKSNKDNKKYKYIIDDNEKHTEILSEGNGIYEIEICDVASIGDKAEILGKTEKINIEIKNITEQIFKTKNTFSIPEINVENALKFNGLSTEEINNEISSYEYDYELANNVKNGAITRYKADVNEVVKNKKGICLDLATLMVSILRDKDIPSRIVFGYNNSEYHSWVEVYDETNGWISYDPTNKRTSYDYDFSNYQITEYH